MNAVTAVRRYRRLVVRLMVFFHTVDIEALLRLPDFVVTEAITMMDEANRMSTPAAAEGAAGYDEYYDDGEAQE